MIVYRKEHKLVIATIWTRDSVLPKRLKVIYKIASQVS